MKNIFVKCCFLLFLLLGLFCDSAAQKSEDLFRFKPGAGIQFFYWAEFSDTDYLLLSERGLLYQAGIEIETLFSRKLKLYVSANADIYFGVVDYDGFLQDNLGNREDYQSETNYLGGELQARFGYRFPLNNKFIIAPEFGLQFEFWNRDIDNGGQYGYDEFYNIYMISAGCNFVLPVSNNTNFFFGLFGEIPLNISESVDLASRGQGGPSNIDLEPGGNFGMNAEFGASVHGALISFTYDYMLLSKSDEENGFYQPKSEREVVTIVIGFSF